MSYDPKYRDWVEKHAQGAEESSELNELYQVYRGVPVLRVKVKDNPPQYRFRAPKARAKNFDRLSKKIDRQLDKTPRTRVKDKTSRKDKDNQDSDEVTYFQKWQNSQMELEDMKRRDASLASNQEELQVKMNELSLARTQLRNEVTDLRKQLEASEATISDLNKKIAQLQSSPK